MAMEREVPGPGQESVWDYPRPPRLEDCELRARVEVAGVIIADSKNTKRMLETSHPPVYYFPLQDVASDYLVESDHRTWCEWKGEAGYVSLRIGDTEILDAGWFYSRPNPRYAELANHVAFYPAKMDACYLDDEQVKHQQSDFYGGWITSKIVGPFKGPPGTRGW